MLALIVEDERAACDRLVQACNRAGDIKVLACVGSAAEALDALCRQPVDVIFLDVQLRGSSAFDLMSHLVGDSAPAVVFTTAFAEHAVAAFEAAAVDYLLKPFSDARLSAALGRVRERRAAGATTQDIAQLRQAWLQLSSQLLANQGNGAGKRLIGEKHRRFVFLDHRDVESIVADHNYVTLTAKGESYIARNTMRQIERQLADTPMMRIHKSVMVNIDHVRHMERGLRGAFLITLHSGAQFRSSPVYRTQLLLRAAPGA